MELFRALGALAEPPSRETHRLAEPLGLGPAPTPGRYEEAFLFQLYPYASVYLGAEGQMGGDARDRIAGFWRALDLEPPPEADHLTLMLGLYARLAELENGATDERSRVGWSHARKAFLWEHLLSWLPVYLTKMSAVADPFYTGWAELLQRALLDEASAAGPPETIALHYREAPELDDPRETGGDGFVQQLLSPIRTGFILVAADLRHAARTLELGLRAGERRFVLEALLSQDAAATLGWLADHATKIGRGYTGTVPLEPALGFWRDRAQRSGELLAALAGEAARANAAPAPER